MMLKKKVIKCLTRLWTIDMKKINLRSSKGQNNYTSPIQMQILLNNFQNSKVYLRKGIHKINLTKHQLQIMLKEKRQRKLTIHQLQIFILPPKRPQLINFYRRATLEITSMIRCNRTPLSSTDHQWAHKLEIIKHPKVFHKIGLII